MQAQVVDLPTPPFGEAKAMIVGGQDVEVMKWFWRSQFYDQTVFRLFLNIGIWYCVFMWHRPYGVLEIQKYNITDMFEIKISVDYLGYNIAAMANVGCNACT